MKYLFLLSLLPSIALAGNEIGKVRFDQGQYGASSTSAGKLFFYLDNSTKNGSPSCATFGGGERWVINNDWPAASMQLSILLTAFTTGKDVHVRGSNDCGVHGDTETALNIVIK